MVAKGTRESGGSRKGQRSSATGERQGNPQPSPDEQRVAMAADRMDADSVDVFVCRLPHNVVMLSGYSPVLGNSFLVYPRLAEPVLIVPESEEDLARRGWIRSVVPYRAAGADVGVVENAVRPILAEVTADKGLAKLVVAFELSFQSIASTYTQIGGPSALTVEMYRSIFAEADIVDAGPTLERMAAAKTEGEIERIRAANEIAAFGFLAAREAIRPGVSEGDVAATMASAVLSRGHGYKGVSRAVPFPHITSGPRSADAYKPFNLTADRRLRKGDIVMAQLEVCADGYWAEVTRTFFVGEPSNAQRRIYETCLAAQARAIEAIGYGVIASEVDAAARQFIAEQGYAGKFKHGLGHEVGFQAISHTRQPRLNPESTDRLGPGMVHNVEPAIYVERLGGVRINDTVLDLPRGAEYISHVDRSLGWAVCE